MRRARLAVVLLALTAAVTAPITVRSAPLPNMSGIALLDYTARPTFKVGDWVKYHVTSTDANGDSTNDYFVTLLIAGQDVWWGEKCFYVETWTSDRRGAGSAVAMLMSYGIFDDSLPSERLQLYQRKLVVPPPDDQAAGGFSEEVTRASSQSLRQRSLIGDTRTLATENLGPDTVRTAKGLYHAVRLTNKKLLGNESGAGDSTIYRERTETRVIWKSPDVPLTHSARETDDVLETRKAWLVGRSRDALPPAITTAGKVTAELVDFGGGLKSKLLPPALQKSFDDAPKPAAKRPATSKPRPAAAKTAR